MIIVVDTVAQHVTEYLDRLSDLFWEAQRVVEGMLTRSVGVELRARVLDLDFKLSTCAISCPLEVQVLEEVGRSGAIKRFVPGARADENTNGSDRAASHGLCADADAILRHAHLHRPVNFQRLRDLTTLKVAEILRSRLTRELQVLSFLLKAALIFLSLLNLGLATIDLV